MKRYFKSIGLGVSVSGLVILAGTTALAQMEPASTPSDMQTAPSTDSADGLSQDLEQQPQSPEELFVQILDLSDEQRTAISGVFTTYQPQIQQAVQAYNQAVSQLNQVLVPSSSNDQISDARNEVLDRERAVYDLIFDRNLAIRDVLNPDQRTTINNALRNLFDLGSVAEVSLPPAQFPMTLVGQSATDTVNQLVADGWEVVVQTPTLVQLNRGSEKLDLAVNRSGQVANAVLN